MAEVIASGPRAAFLSEAARVLEPGGRIFINTTRNDPFGLLKGVDLDAPGLRVVQELGPLAGRFANQTFRRTDGSVVPIDRVRTTILERVQ